MVGYICFFFKCHELKPVKYGSGEMMLYTEARAKVGTAWNKILEYMVANDNDRLPKELKERYQTAITTKISTDERNSIQSRARLPLLVMYLLS